MSDENNLGPAAVIEATDAEAKTPAAKKQKPPQRQKTTVKPAQSSNATAAESQATKRRSYSEQEKTGKLKLIDTQVTEGKSTLKDAIKKVGISEQTYYNWKRTGTPVVQMNEKPVPAGDELADLVQLENENQRLRKLLAEKLRSENSELRKRLGLS
ncbi:transposase [Rhizobium laguerreae]|uniref:transposase n=1 Tax=Rhizobium laguerreae TaxID=1076926 RepID=UPI001C907005|nr:transposase [Rhizobium laguerreae]MBY3158023.1 transposase [Rhizobium laguerreae]MBY3447032.1 transposase [Rhizobium laguerreae]